MMANSEERHFMAHPEVEEYLRDLLPTLISESDRGAVLLAASQIDEQLKRLFECLLPEKTSNKRKKEIFNPTGPFGGFCSKLDVAYVCRVLPASLVQAIHKFRKLRNTVAHEALSFRLQDHKQDIYEIFALVGPGVDLGVNRMALELMFESMLAQLTTVESPTDEGKPLFEDRGAVLDYLGKNAHLFKVAADHQQRWELGIGVGIICGLITYHRERLVAALGPENTLVPLLGKVQEPDIEADQS